jgi:hypothetical protein
MANLARLQRSLHKIDEDHSVSYGRQGWAELLEAYKQAGRK